MRCAALGIRLARKGMAIHFASVSMPLALAAWLKERGFVAHDLTVGDEAADMTETRAVAERLGGVDLLVVDHYGLSRSWEQGMRGSARRILAIDDLGRDHDCDVLLDQNLRRDADVRYNGRLPAAARQFIGPRFALLRPEFDAPDLTRIRDGRVDQLLVFFGGTDPGNQTLKVIEALRRLGDAAPPTTVVLGPAHPDRGTVHAQTAGMSKVKVLDATNEMARLFRDADLAIGACGIAAWERCVLSLPSIVVVTAENQREDAEILDGLGALDCIGDAVDVTADDWAQALSRAIASPERLVAMGAAAQAVMHGRHDGFAELERALAA